MSCLARRSVVAWGLRRIVPSGAFLAGGPIMEIRAARPEDAPAACEVMRRSIAELCVADHNGDPDILQRWLANKTPEIVGGWISNPANTVLVAVEAGVVLAVGLMRGVGEIELNYVSPDARFRGVSRSMMQALEAKAIEQGASRCTLISTETARRFYHSRGYAGDGAAVRKFGTTGGYPMVKDLTG
jgi:GNAT superfamily N-acetyltransferase